MSKRKPTYQNEPLGKLAVVPDFLPAPEALVLKEEAIKVTLALSKKSVDFFKETASKHHTRYQESVSFWGLTFSPLFRQSATMGC